MADASGTLEGIIPQVWKRNFLIKATDGETSMYRLPRGSGQLILGRVLEHSGHPITLEWPDHFPQPAQQPLRGVESGSSISTSRTRRRVTVGASGIV